MIPASYLFRAVYRDRFEHVEPHGTEPAPAPGSGALDRITAAILGFAYGAAHLPLHLGAAAPHDRRR